MSTIVELAQTLYATSSRLAADGYPDESIAVGACADYLMAQERKRNGNLTPILTHCTRERIAQHCRTIAGQKRRQAR